MWITARELAYPFSASIFTIHQPYPEMGTEGNFESQRQFRSMADSAPAMIWLSGLDKRCTWFNRAWLDFVGRPMEAEIGDGWVENVHPDDLDRCFNTYVTAFDRRMPFSMEYRLKHHDGEYRDLIDKGSPNQGPKGDFIGYIGSCTDVSALKAKIGELERSEARYGLFMEEIQQAFIVHKVVNDDNGRVVDLEFEMLNPAAERVFGRPRAEFIGRRRSDVLGPMEEHFAGMVERVIQTRTAVKEERYVPSIDRWFETYLTSPEPGRIASLNLDITDRKRAEDGLRRMNALLEERVEIRTRELSTALQRTKELSELKSRFVAIASHEFRTPLSAVLLSASLIDKYTELGDVDKCRKHVNKIKEMVKNMRDVLNDFLSVEQLEQNKVTVSYEQLDLQQALIGLTEEIGALLKPGQVITSTYDGNREVIMDLKILRTVVLNLLSNAIKYSNTEVLLHTMVDTEGITITVKDDGIGIPKAHQEHLFSAFFRAGNVGDVKGTGLGLSIAKRSVGLIGGSIEVSSAEGHGSAFTVRFPIVELGASSNAKRDDQRSNQMQ